jgi:hypothetical protein
VLAFTAGLSYVAFPSVHLTLMPHLPQESAFALAQLSSIYQWARLSGRATSLPTRSSCAYAPLRRHWTSSSHPRGYPWHRRHHINVRIIKIARRGPHYPMHRSVLDLCPPLPSSLTCLQGGYFLGTSLSSTRCSAKLPMPVTRPLCFPFTVLSTLWVQSLGWFTGLVLR